jgi:hypothetical protein
LLHLSSVQTWLLQKIAGNLSEKLDTRVTIKKVDFRFFDKLLLKDLMVEDQKKDTLLFAGTASVNITDWFFLKDTITLNNVGLEDAVVNMHRTDSVWNYQFLLDYFSTPSTGKKKNNNLQVDIKEVHFKNIKFNKTDNWVGQGMVVSLQKLDISMEKMDIAQKQIFIKDIYLEKPLFSQRDFDGKRPTVTNLTGIMAQIPVVSAFKWNQSGWQIKINKLQIFDGSFANNRFTTRGTYPDRFDGLHLLFSSINGSINDVQFLNDTLQANILLNAKERSGLEVKKLQSHLKFTPELMEFKQLDLQTNKSKLGDYYSMQYNSFNSDMSSFIHNVTLVADLKESILSTDDLAFFAPELAKMKRVFYIEGKAKGSIDNFSASYLKLKTGNTFFDGNIAMRGLPDINSTFIDLHSNLLNSNYNDLITIIPSLKNVQKPAFNKLGAIKYTGNFTGFINDFVAFGNINTNLGNLNADLNMKLPTAGEPTYSGKLKTAGFNLGAFLNDQKLGMVALNGTINGKNFNLAKLNANFKGQISRLDYANYPYQNISINGDFKNKIFRGNASIDDPNIKISRLNGELSLSGKELAFNADAHLEYINFKNLGFSKDLLTLSGLFSLNFTGNTIDNFLGTASVYNANLQHDSVRMSFDSLLLKSYIVDGRKSLSVQSNELEASINGAFKILELPDAFSVFLSKYYPSYIKLPKNWVSDQDFNFDIKTNHIDDYIQLLDKKLMGFNNAHIDGSLKLSSYELKVNALVPDFSYDGKQFINASLHGNGNRDTLFADIAVDDIILSDSLHFPETKLQVAAHNDVSVISLKTSASKTLNDAELNASIQTLPDGVRIHFFPSAFVVNDKKWTLEKDGELTIRKNYIDANEVKFSNNEQQLVLSTEMDDVTDDIYLIARLNKLVIEDFLPLWVTDPSLKGRLTGIATIHDPLGKQIITFKGIADSFSLDDKYVGKVNIEGSVNTITGLIDYKVATNEKDYVFNVDGFYNYKDSIGTSTKNTILADKINLNILEPYLGSIFSQINGTAKGHIVIAEEGKGMTIIGDAIVDSGSFKVAFTQCRYNIANETIHFGENEIDLGSIRLRDTLNNTGSASGKMYHKFFKDFRFENVRVETSKMLVLNTTKKDNSQFYGTVIGSALMTLDGPTTSLKMNIDGQPSVFDSSHIYLNTDVTSKENTKIDYIDFIQFGSEMDAQSSNNKATNIMVNLNVAANPGCKVDVILDEQTGDIIKGQGNGKLNIKVGTTDPLSIRGRYDITKGEYTFNFQTLLKKPFTLSRGSITWNGDPLLAIIDIDAEYLAKNVDVSSITQNPDIKRKEDITIISNLSGNLAKPKISFDFRLPENSDLNRDYYTTKKLADYKNNENEMFKQVASLLLVNSFITGDQGFLTGGSTFNIATSTIGGVLSGFLTNVFNKELERATNGIISTYIDINPTVDMQSTVKQLQANVRAGLKIFLSSRVNVIVGGNLDYNNPYLQTSGLVTPDITLEWLLNKDGSVRVVGFSKTSTDLTSNQRNRSGLQLSYRKDFDKLSDIFKSRKKVLAQDSIKVSFR